jgi:hypothetical protein
MKQDNTMLCQNCKRRYISEEFQNHICQRLVITIFDTDGNRWGSYDRITFFPLPPFPKIPTNLQQPKKTPDEDNTTHLLVVPQWVI